MSEERRNADNHLKPMLRQWGEGEPARSTSVVPAPAVRTPWLAGPPWTAGRRIAWSAAAAVVLCGVATSFYFLGVSNIRYAGREDAMGEGSPAYAELKAKYDTATQATADANRERATKAHNDGVVIDGLRSQVKAMTSALAGAQGQPMDADTALDKAKADFAAALQRDKEPHDILWNTFGRLGEGTRLRLPETWAGCQGIGGKDAAGAN